MTAPRPAPAQRLRVAAGVVLVAGWLAAAAVYLAAPEPARADAYGGAYAAKPEGSVREQQALERLGGKAAVGAVAFNRWVASLWHGRRLAYTLAAGATVVGLLCLHIAGLMAEDVDD